MAISLVQPVLVILGFVFIQIADGLIFGANISTAETSNFES